MVFVFPTRKINLTMVESINTLQVCLNELNFKYEINIVSNTLNDIFVEGCNVYYDGSNNAAISRNIGILNSNIDHGDFFLIDDDIVLDKNNLFKLFQYLKVNEGTYILAPYLSGFYLNKNYKFNLGNRLFYSWIFGYKVDDYLCIQGKSVYSYNFPPIFLDKINKVDWATGGFLVFKGFDKKNCLFDLCLFRKFYFLEDYFLTYSNNLKGVQVIMLPICFTHLYLNSNDKSIKILIYEVFNLESNRLKIFLTNKKNTNESLLKFKFSLILFYFYRLKEFKIKNIVSFFTVLYLCLFNIRKSL
jgi:hypothetical protein